MTTTAQRRRPTWRSARISIAAAFTLSAALVSGLIVPGSMAHATDQWGYPTWSEVEAASNNVAAKNQQIAEIQSLLQQLETNLATAQALADQRATEATTAQAAFDEASFVADQLQQQADDATATAGASALAASQMAAELARQGGAGDMSAELFANPGSADQWLYRLGLIDHVAGTADSIYAEAQQDANSAQALQDQAAVARDELQALSEAAQAAYDAAVQAAADAQAVLVEQNTHRVELETQLAVLVENRAATEADYQAGQRWQAYLAEQERLRLEREAAERAAAAAAAAAAQEAARASAAAAAAAAAASGATSPAPSAPSAPAPSTGVTQGGWTSPHYGRVTSEFGWRWDPVGTLGYKLHGGIDISAGSGTPEYAIAAGTVAFVGRDSYGANMITINHGGGVVSEYYHMIARSPLHAGQSVSAGQVVGYEGSTGHVTGPHLHFQIRVNGGLVNPRDFLAIRGVYL